MTTEYTPNFGLALPDFRMGPWHDLLNSDLRKIDQILFGALSSVDTPPWANNTFYDVGVTAFDQDDASTWMCGVAHTSALTGTFGDDRIAHPTYWVRLLTGFAPRGQWLNSTNYFPYDLVYDASLGVMALCSLRHVSSATGNIKDDASFWEFLIDMSASDLSAAIAVTYSNAGSGIPRTNVQEAIDYVQSEIVALNNVNISQGNDIIAIQTKNNTQDTSLASLGSRMTTAESSNASQDSSIGNHETRIAAIETALAAGTTFPTGTKMLFYQPAAPVGWTKMTVDNDKILRVVSGTTGGSSGGVNSFSTVNLQSATGNHVLTISEIPPHHHDGFMDANAAATAGISTGGDPRYGRPNPTGDTGGGLGHSHPLTLNMQYIDIIAAIKN